MGANRNLSTHEQSIAIEIKGYLSNLEFDFVDNDLLEDIKEFFKDKYAKNATTNSDNVEEDTMEDEEDVSHEAQVSFLIDHGIKIKNNIKDLKSDYIAQNFYKVEFYGVQYYLRIKDYGTEQNVYNFLIDKHIVSVAA
ncbi:hypothetical protein [Seonamhaeicola marinus]|uniref:Uncharacterized protein n=1 Tax=Seonamhaeicola marinus TaxID=1912246 RepID=A0A5D0I4B0_9FLAO|nr:hypothetical protein [Seonamhaeicola marinus]TYA78494.1 hypothetical protein FUA24_09045 [Seonamhaeicola marinus]